MSDLTVEMLNRLIRSSLEQSGFIVWLTGAGISAESGIPTFRGKDGYWQVGSQHYQPQDMATLAAFHAMPDEVWSWYLYRRGICRAARPNKAHLAIAAAEKLLKSRFRLITQNVDGLHLRAGHDASRIFQIHGNIDFMRPLGGGPPVPISPEIPTRWPREKRLSPQEREFLCIEGQPARPHVLWFDETYDEDNFYFESSLKVALDAALLVVIGTTGATNLPLQIGQLAFRQKVPLIVINPEPNPFSRWIEPHNDRRGLFLQGTAGHWVPLVVRTIGEILETTGTSGW